MMTVTDSEDDNDDITEYDDITEEPKLEMDVKIQEKLPETDLLEHNKTRKGSCCMSRNETCGSKKYLHINM
jgi:hypothetical protein